VPRTRQGLRRLKALNPATAFHDCYSYSERRYPRILLDQRTEDDRRGQRREYLKERDMKKYRKMGVCRTEFHKIESLPDCEFIAIADLVPAARAANALVDTNVDAFFEQMSARIKKDADLVPINDLIALLQEFHKNEYLDIGLVNKIKNEIVYDIDRVRFPELAVALFTILGEWNIVSPRLIKATLKRAAVLASDESTDASAACILLKSLKNCPNGLLWRNADNIQALVTLVNGNASSLTFSELSSTIVSMQYLTTERNLKISDLKPSINILLSKEVSDVKSLSDALSVCQGNEEKLQNLFDSVEKYRSSLIEASCSDDWETRYKSVNIVAPLIKHCDRLARKDLVEALTPAITAVSVRPMRPRGLVDIVRVLNGEPQEIVIKDLRRKESSLGNKLRKNVLEFLQ
jgi:hypothetical protein